MKSIYKICAVTILFTSFSALSSSNHPSDKMVMESATACVGIAQKNSGDARRFPADATRAFISSEVDKCVQLLSWSRLDNKTGKSLAENIESDWNRSEFNVDDEQYKFYSEFHRNIISAATRAAVDPVFLQQMVKLGEMTASNNASRNF
ncbi:hypothetical protein [Enterobacter asburiae]|uniref:hypothetical protein n=1 Tax=Enterobacter asburiae TaxID=61645 RepID=UPI0034D346B6